MMLAHHIGLYALVDGKKQGDHDELQPDEENAEAQSDGNRHSE